MSKIIVNDTEVYICITDIFAGESLRGTFNYKIALSQKNVVIVNCKLMTFFTACS